MRNKGTRLIALSMIWLVLTLPFFVADASAANLVNVISSTGKDNIPHIRASENDYLDVVAGVKVTDNLTELGISDLSNYLEIAIAGYTGWGAGFTQCTDAGAGWQECYYRYPSDTYDALGPGRYDYTVTLFPNTPQKRAYDSTFIVVDGLGPIVDNFQVTPAESKGGEVKLGYTITDKACMNSECGNYCSGVKKVDLYDYASGEMILTFNYDTNDCTINKQESIDVSGLADGEYTLCIVPYDMFDQANSQYVDSYGNLLSDNPAYDKNCVSLKKNSQEPALEYVAILDETQNFLVTHVSPNGNPVWFVANISTNLFPLKNNQIMVDLSELGNTKVIVPCEPSYYLENFYTCKHAFVANIGATTQKVDVTGTDTIGNVMNLTIQFSIGEDSTKPVVNDVVTNYQLNGTSFFGPKENIVIANLYDVGAGFNYGNVQIDVGSETDMNFTCAGSGSNWQCYNEVAHNFSGTPSTVSVRVIGTDDVGYSFENNGFSKIIVFDSQKPSIVQAIVETAQSVPYVLAGDDIIIRVNVTDNVGLVGDDGNMNIYADFSDIADVTDFSFMADSCTYNDVSDSWMCEWPVRNVFGEKLKAKFNISDMVGNYLSKTVSEFVLQYTDFNGSVRYLPEGEIQAYILDNATPNFWSAKVSAVMPSFLDGDTLAIIPYRQWHKVDLTRRSSSAQIAYIDFAGCEGEDLNNYVQDVELLLPNPTKKDDIFFKIIYAPALLPEGMESLSFTCRLAITTIYGDKMSMPELVNVTIATPVTVAGDISDEVWAEIDEVASSWLVKKGFLWTLERWINLANNICSILRTVLEAIKIFQGDIGAAATVADASIVTKPAGTAGKLAGEAAGKAAGVIDTVNEKFCKWLSCEKGLWKGPYDKLMEKSTEWVTTTGSDTGGAGGNDKADDKGDDTSDGEADGDGKTDDAGGSGGAANCPGGEDCDPTLPAPQAGSNPNEGGTAHVAPIPTGAMPDMNLITGMVDNPPTDDSGTEKKGWKDRLFGTSDKSSEPEPEEGFTDRRDPNILGKMNMKPTMWPTAPKNSLILSAATGCLPGILYNLNKARQIECQYLNCLYNDVSRGVPYFVCVRVRNYGWCRYVMGEIFQLIPYANFVHWLSGIVQGLLSNPLSMVLGIAEFACTVFIPVTPAWSACWVFNMLSAIGSVVKDIIAIKSMDWSLKDSCGEILDQIESEHTISDTIDSGEVAT